MSKWPLLVQDAVRGDHGEVANLLANKGGKVWKAAEGQLRALQESHLAGCAASATC
jgi:hypothetical protein